MTGSTWAEICGLFTGAAAGLSLPWEQLPLNHDHPIIDIGAGTGLQTIQLAEAFDDHEVLAIEPDAAMRVALMTRIADRPDLHDRVTVYPLALADLPSELSFGAALLHNVVYELADLPTAFADLHRRAAPGGSVIINHLHVPSTAAPVARRLITTTRLGRLHYERWFERRPRPDGRMEVINSYRMLEGDRVINTDEERRVVTGLDNDRVAEQATAAGFVVDGETAPGYWILTRS